jgi:hypothetical protein
MIKTTLGNGAAGEVPFIAMHKNTINNLAGNAVGFTA